ncbi:MAG: hypothetical protein A2017_17460 [Lentisphaerae bacterium GWF2_44_16]|nr:MAG: hypothetical protein A2017_17460 [Lentisphaerae bacterium GWF2_44_16]HAU65899.1 recombinase family protein [Candidatus Uhrbacteria bacterium]
MQNKQVKIIKPVITFEQNENGNFIPTKKRVCAYCRVSTDNIEQKTSYDAQVDEYTKRIISNPTWQMVRIYADEGLSGTSTKNRKEFNAMIEASRNGEIDLILTKSISRFTRNTVDCLNYIRELRTLGVEIYFEKENIYSSDTKVDFLLTIMSSIAQEEARNVSENVKWNIRKRFSEGDPIVNNKRFLGYTRDKETKQLIPIPDQAAIVKEIFSLYVSGIGPARICQLLQAKGYKTGAGRTYWRNSTINFILSNEKYCGDLIMQKTITTDYLTHKRVKNDNIAPKFHVEDNHEPIIDRETFLLAQQIKETRAKQTVGKDKNLSKYTYRYPFSGIIICHECGRALKRRYWNYGTPSARVMQQCGGYVEGKHNCRAKALYQESVEGASLQMLNEVFWNNPNTMELLEKAFDKNVIPSEHEVKLATLEKEKSELQSQLAQLVDLKISTPDLSEEIFMQKYQALNGQIRTKMNDINATEKQIMVKFQKESKLSQMKKILARQTKPFEELDVDTFRIFIYRIIAISRTQIVFCISTDKEYSDAEFASRRFEFSITPTISDGLFLCQKYKNSLRYNVVIL